MQRSTVERVASARRTSVRGAFFRHAALNRDAFAGGQGGRWGGRFPVIYLARPRDAATIEAYRHLVEATGVPARMVQARVLYEVRVDVDNILDLTERDSLKSVGLGIDDLQSEVGDYGRCQEVGGAAHQLGFHGLIAPAAHGRGETLALFREHLAHDEMPQVVEQVLWRALPADPRALRVVHRREEGGLATAE